jgi:hypothetical protein
MKMKTFALAVVAVTAIAIPSLASAAEQTYWDPADSTFAVGSMKAPATTNNDTARYTETVTSWDPDGSAFVTTKVGATPVVGTHDAVKTSRTIVRMWDPDGSNFVEVPVGN